MKNLGYALISLLLILSSLSQAKEQGPKGLLPELKIDSTNEDENQKKALQSELLITKSENQAIRSLQSILKKQKGTPAEADLWYRLAELYMRRAKSGRFFDLSRNSGDAAIAARFAPPEVQNETAVGNLKRAIGIYLKIDRDFPKFREMDAVLFNAAFASQQIGLKKQADALYYKVVTNHPKSPLVPDAHLALGELKYESQNFKGALEHFVLIQKYPQSRVYSYGMYKAGWSFYNLHQTDKAIDKMIEVVKYHDPKNANGRKVSHNLRGEAIRDLTIFFEETSSPDKAIAFFSQFITSAELADVVILLGQLYDSHSKHKEMIVFLNDFIKATPNSAKRVKAHILMVSANESLRHRREVLHQLKELDQVCKQDSSWATENASIYDESCNYDFAKANIEVAKKWWDLWLKNKNGAASEAAKELAGLTQQAFKIHLDREDPLKPDSKSRYAYAELLFQVENFRMASEQYAHVGEKTADTQLQHDANYAALVALEKAVEKKKESGDDEKLLALSQNYLLKHPQGEHAIQVQFKVGFLAYEKNDLNEAEKWLKPLAASEKSGEFKRKSEDLVLDILNARKDYKGIKEFSKQIAAQTKDDSRKASLTKIMQEADYTEIQEFSKAGEKAEASQKLYAFYRENKSSPLAKDALWQAMSLSYSSGRIVEGADLAREYAAAFPDEAKTLDALKDAAKAYTESGHVLLAAQTMELIVQKSMGKSPKDVNTYTDASAELYLLEGNKKQAISSFNRLLADANKETQGKILSRILVTMKGQEDSAEYLKIEGKLQALGQEPYASEINFKRVQALWDAKKPVDAFNAAKALVAPDRGIPDEVRAKARLIQAKTLELEFLQQSTKTTIEKLSLILSLKTEKLDKAQTAYMTASKLSQNPNVQLEALQGLNRIYKNYVETVSHPIIKTNLKEDELKAVEGELAKLTAPIAEKMQETGKRLTRLAKESKASRSEEVDFTNLPAEDSVKARIKDPPADKLMPFLPVIAEGAPESSSIQRYQGSKSIKCSLAESEKTLPIAALSAKANQCIQSKNLALAEKIASQMSRNEPKNSLGTYYMSVISDLQGHTDKALWLIELSLKKNEDQNFAMYQKARVLYKMNDYADANKFFVKAYDQKLNAAEVYLMHGVMSYAEGDCYSVVDDFAKLDAKNIFNYGLGAAYGECHAQKGELDKGLAIINKQLQINSLNIDLLLEAAYINEIYKSDSAAKIKAYENALKAASQPEIHDWIKRKLAYLKGTTLTVSMSDK
jgi:cellulose synthase operon protein C